MGNKIIQPIAATVKLVTGVKTGQFGEFRSVLFALDEGGEVWKSFPPNSEELQVLKPGSRVRLIPNGQTRSGKDSHVIEILEQKMNSRQPTTQSSKQFEAQLCDDKKREIASYVQQLADIYRFCFGQSVRTLNGVTEDPETLRCCTSSLFIQAVKKFNI
jgi:hypothetical protein